MIMNNNLFKTLFIPAVACLLGACAESMDPDMETSGNSGAIRFAGPAVTRAAIDDTDEMLTNGNSFSVWGNYTDGAGGTATSVFNAEKVTYVSGMWGYEGTRYWLAGKTYDFYALYPSKETLGDGVSVACTDGTFTVKGFDATKGHDLMTAEKTDIVTETGNVPEAVSFEFFHRLTRLAFNVKAVGRDVTVTSFKVNGVIREGDLTHTAGGTSEWSNTTTTTADDRLLAASDVDVASGKTQDMLGNVLLPPHTDLTGAEIAISYRFEGETADRSSTVSLSGGSAEQWDAGRRYAYTLTVSAASLEIKVKVLDWDEEDTSVSWN